MRIAPVLVLALSGSSGCVRTSDAFAAPTVGACGDVDTPSTLRVVTWNIRAALSSSIDTIAGELAALDADVVALQEVDRNASRSGDIDQATALGDALGMASTFAAARAEGHGEFGVALLSRIPFENARRMELPSDNAFEPRVAVDAHLCAGDFHLRAASVHADIYPWSARQNADVLADDLRESMGEGVVVGGDLNDTPDGDGPAAFTTRGFVDASADAPTFADRRIDYVFVDTALTPGAGARVADSEASDHRPMVVDLTLPAPAVP
jgi:endonuclease/exonuclease/phosphatase family metal-dependent hydrolase